MAGLAASAAGCLLYTDPVNTPPELTKIAADSAQIFRGKDVKFAAAVSDAEQDEGSLELAWGTARECSAAPTPADVRTRVFAFRPTLLGTFCVWVSATDEHGATAFLAQSFSVNNRAPDARIDIVKPAPAGDGVVDLYSDVRLSGARSLDPDADKIAYRWRMVGPGGQTQETPSCPDSPGGADVCFPVKTPGKYAVELVAQDEHNGASDPPAALVLMVAEDRPPCIKEAEPLVGLPRVPAEHRKTTLFSVTFVKDDGDPYQRPTPPRPGAFTWSWRRGTSGPFQRVAGGPRSDFEFPAGFFRPADVAEVRVSYEDRIARDFSPCERAVPQPAQCEVQLGSGCYQWVTWTIEYY